VDFVYSIDMSEEPSWITNLLYPGILLGIGTGITYLLGTTLTRKYQEKQKARDIEREDLHRSIAIKDDLIREFSDTIVVIDNIVGSVYLLHTNEKTQDRILVLNDDFNEFQSKIVKLMLLIKLYFGESSEVFQEISLYIGLGLLIKNFGILDEKKEREKLKNNILVILEHLVPKNISKVVNKNQMKEFGLPDNFYTDITTKVGVWGSDFSQKILDAKLKPEITKME